MEGSRLEEEVMGEEVGGGVGMELLEKGGEVKMGEMRVGGGYYRRKCGGGGLYGGLKISGVGGWRKG